MPKAKGVDAEPTIPEKREKHQAVVEEFHEAADEQRAAHNEADRAAEQRRDPAAARAEQRRFGGAPRWLGLPVPIWIVLAALVVAILIFMIIVGGEPPAET